MSRIILTTLIALTSLIIFFSGSELSTQEHPGKEEKINPDKVREAIMSYIQQDTKLKGYFLIWDDKEQHVWKLDFSKLHEKAMVLKDETYFMCTDFKAEEKQPDGSVKTATLDIDFWLDKGEDSNLKVSMIKIHKVRGVPRFQYEEDEIKPIKE